MERVFTALGMEWKRGDYHRTEFSVNPANVKLNISSLVPRYSQKANHASGVVHRDAVYNPTADCRTQSNVFSPEPVADLTQCSAAFAACGEGRIGYIGDVNAEEETTAVIIAMCGI